jgi:Notch-like protein
MKNSHGYDGISTKILKFSLLYISLPINYICNKMLSTSIFPTRLKFSEIKILFEKRDKTHLSNYRPISLLTFFSKIFENIVYRRLYYHIYCNHILVNEQFGFTNNQSTEISSYNLTNVTLSSLNSKLLLGGVFCDLQNAIDCINHYILL